GGRRAGLPEARGPEPHRRTQDQQLHRPGGAGAADGQAPADRRDRSRAARRGDGDGGGAVRAAVRGLHGRRRCRSPVAQRRADAAGLFAPFVGDASVRLVGVEAAGDGIATGRHAATLGAGRVGVLHGSKSYVLVRDDGQIAHAHSISAGLDYPGVGPEHAAWKETGAVTYLARTDADALAALERLARSEGILCALETAHAIAALDEVARTAKLIVVGLSGRGDKDMT